METVLKHLEEKRTLTAMPGRKYDSLYYNKDSSKVEIIENLATFGKYRVNLSSPQYGSTSTVTFPNMNFIGKCILHLELPVPSGGAAGNSALTRGWGLALIQSIDLLVGNANISTQKIERASMFHSLVASCQTAEALDFNLRAAGEAFNGSYPADLQIEGKIMADVVIDLPWSNYCTSMADKLYFDTSLLTAPISLNITFNQPQSIWGTSYTPPSNSFTAQLTYRQLELTNKNLSLRNVLFKSPGSAISYPSCYRQFFRVPFVAQAAPGVSTDPASFVSLNLMQFLNADLLGISLSCHLTSEITPSAANTPVSPWNTLDMYDVEISFGGEVVYGAPRWSYRLINQESSISTVYLVNDVQYNPTPGSAGTIINAAKKASLCFIDLARLRQFCRQETFFNTIRLANQVLTIRFRLPPTYPLAGNNVPIASQNCELHAVYYYPQITEVNSTGSVNIFYN